jgi:L-iditol 2-dehydrogenase
MVVAVNRVFPIPDGVPFERAAFVEPFAACLAAVKVASVPLGASVLVTGAGTMGLMTLQLARRSGAARAIVSEPNPARREQALRLGADTVVDPREGGLRDVVLDVTSGAGVDVALETAGHPAALKDCLGAVADRGTVVLVGVHPVSTRIDFEVYPFHRRNLTLKGSYGVTGPDDVRAAVKWLGQLEFDSLISHRYPFTDLTTAFAVARAGAGKVMIQLA